MEPQKADQKTMCAVETINAFFAHSLWMELTYTKISHNEIRLHGSVDEDANPDYDEIDIIFDMPQAFSSLFYDLDTATKQPFIALVTEQEFTDRTGLPVYPDTLVFRLSNEDDSHNYIVARGLNVTLTKSC